MAGEVCFNSMIDDTADLSKSQGTVKQHVECCDDLLHVDNEAHLEVYVFRAVDYID